jgi:hypothetical protein
MLQNIVHPSFQPPVKHVVINFGVIVLSSMEVPITQIETDFSSCRYVINLTKLTFVMSQFLVGFLY